jgi:hypothetical protein
MNAGIASSHGDIGELLCASEFGEVNSAGFDASAWVARGAKGASRDWPGSAAELASSRTNVTFVAPSLGPPQLAQKAAAAELGDSQ